MMNNQHTGNENPSIYSSTTRTSPMLYQVEYFNGIPNYFPTFNLESIVFRNSKINNISRGKVFVQKSFLSEYIYESQDNPGVTVLKACRRLCGFDIYLIGSGEPKYIGFLKSNLLGTYYTLYMKGEKILTIEYKTSWIKRKKPRSFIVSFYKNIEGLSIKDSPIIMINKQPYYNVENNSYSLNFNGRVTTPSVKNFQLVHPLDLTYVTLTFGKTSSSTYILDYTYPLCGLYGFAISLAALDKKICCD